MNGLARSNRSLSQMTSRPLGLIADTGRLVASRPSAKGFVGAVVALGCWQVISFQLGSLPTLQSIAITTYQDLSAGRLTTALVDTLYVSAIGLVFAVLVGVPLGIAVGISSALERTTRALFEFIRPIPSVAFIPVAIIALGIGSTTKIFVVAFACTWIVLFNSKAGAESVDPRLQETGRAVGLSEREVIWKIVLPASLPLVATGIRLASSTALVVAITAEMILGGTGIGFYIESSRIVGRLRAVWAGALVAGLVGVAVNWLFLRSEARLLRWSKEHRPTDRADR